MSRILSIAMLVAASTLSAIQVQGAETLVDRGRYLVTISGCSDCHTPGGLLGKPDERRLLGGSDVGFGIPGLGVFAGSNLTPDAETGLGKWSEAQIIAAITTGARPDGRILAPVMPWAALSNLSKSDARAIAAYLKSLPPVRHAVPGPFAASETPAMLVSTVLPGAIYAKLPKSQK